MGKRTGTQQRNDFGARSPEGEVGDGSQDLGALRHAGAGAGVATAGAQTPRKQGRKEEMLNRAEGVMSYGGPSVGSAHRSRGAETSGSSDSVLLHGGLDLCALLSVC